MPGYVIHLVNVRIAEPTATVRAVIEEAFAPLARRAGCELELVNVSEAGACDVSLEFISNPPVLGQSFMNRPIVLAEQSGGILVGSILEMRAGRMALTPSTRMASTRPLFERGDEAFARAVGNIAVHELAHTIGGLDHHPTAGNYLYSSSSLIRHRLPSWFTYNNLRAYFSGNRTFDEQQQADLVDAISNRQLRGIGLIRAP